MNDIFLGLGTNLGDRVENLHSARRALSQQLGILKESDVYQTEPWGHTDQPNFLNQALQIETSFTPQRLLEILKSTEQDLGRTPSFEYGPRIIDIDILFYGDAVLEEPLITIPHPHIKERAFVLVPLAEIAPHFVHPIFGLTIQQLAASIDAGGVHKYTAESEGA